MRRMPFILIPLMCDHVAFSSSDASQCSVIDPSQQLSSVADCRETVARLGQDLTLDELLSELVSLNPATTRFVLSLKDRYEAVQRVYLDGAPSLLGGKPVSKWTDAEFIAGIEILQTKKAFAIESIIAIIQRAVVLTYGYEARLPQILSTISILDSKDAGRLLQIATGEGKTLTTAMIAAAKALQGHKVDVISSSPVLAMRDGKSIQSFLTKLGLTVGINQEDDTSSDDKQDDGSQRTKESSKQNKVKLYNHPIVYGSIGQFQGDYLRTVYLDQPGRGDRPFDTVLVDEVDSSMIDEIHHITMLSEHQTGMEFLQVILTAIWNKVVELNQHVVYIPSKGYYVYVYGDFSIKEGELYLHTTKGAPERAVHIIQDSHAFKRNFLLTFTTEILRSASFKVPAHLSSFINDHIAEWATSALWASYHQENVTYVCGVSPDGAKSIMPVDVQNTGIVQQTMHWGDGVHQFLQLKHGLPLTAEGFIGSFISHIGYIKKYARNIFGMSGTLGDVATSELFNKVYAVDLLRIPRFRARKFREVPGRMLATPRLWKAGIIDSVREQAALGKGCLVICKTIQEAMDLHEIFKAHFSEKKLKLYARSDDKQQESIVETTLEAGDVIVATNLAGRGTDIKVSKEVLAAGGMHVCLTFLSRNSRVEEQAFGRTARKGEPGTGELLLCKSHVIHQLGQALPADIAIEQIRGQRDSSERKRLKAIMHKDVPHMLMKDRLFVKVCELRNRLKCIDANGGRLDEFNDQWSLEHHMIDTSEERVIEHAKDELESKISRYGLALDHGVDDLDTFYHAISQQLEEKYTPEEIKRLAFKHQLAQKYSWTDVELKELAKKYHDSRRWSYKDNEMVLALSKALGHSLIVCDEYRVDIFADQTKGHKRLFLAKARKGNDFSTVTYYSASRTEGSDYSSMVRALESCSSTLYREPYLDRVNDGDVDKVLSYCAEETLRTLDDDNWRKERNILKHFDTFAKRIETEYRSGKTFMKRVGNLCAQAMKTKSSTQRISILTEAIRQDPEYSYGAYYQRATEIIKAKKKNYKQDAMADFKQAKEQTKSVKSIWEALLITYKGDSRDDLAQQLQAKIQYLERFMKQCDRNTKQIRTCKSGNEIVLGRYTCVSEFKGVGGLNNDAMFEFIKAGAPGYYELEERAPPTSWTSVFTVGFLGVMQVVVGAIITVASGGAVGTSLISEGIKDIWTSVKLAYNGGAFDWEGYFAEKSLSIAFALIQLGGGAILDKIAGKTTTIVSATTSKATQEATAAAASTATSKTAQEVATNAAMSEVAQEVAQEVTMQTMIDAVKKEGIKTITQIGIMEASHWTSRQIIDSFSDDIYESLKKSIADKLKSGTLSKDLEATWIIDAHTNATNDYQQWVLKEVDQVLKDKQSRMIEMIGRVGGMFTSLFKEKKMISGTTANVIVGALEVARATAEAAEIMMFVDEVIAELGNRVHTHITKAPTLTQSLKKSCDAVDWLEHLEYGAYSEGCRAHHIKILKELALRDGVQETDSASTRPWWDVDVSQEVCDAVVQWLLTHKIISSERPWTKGGIGVNGEERAKLIALEEMRKQDREQYKALVIVGGTLNSLEKQHLDGHRTDGFIKALSEQLEDQLHMVLTHRLSATVGKSIDTAANMGLNAYMETCEAETQRQTEAALKELRKHSVLFKLPDKKPIQPWEMDRIADEPEYVPYSQRYAPSKDGSGPNSGSGLVKPEYRWLTPMSGTQATPKPATASAKAHQYADSMGAIQRLREKEKLSQPTPSVKPSGKPASALDLLISPVAGSVGVAPMSGFNPAVALPVLGNPAIAVPAAGIALMLGMDYQTHRREVELAYEGWRKGDASLLPDMVWSQPAAREIMEREMGYPFGRPDLAPAAVTKLESPLPTRAPQACGGLDIPVQEKPQPLITPMPAPKMPNALITPQPEQKHPEPMITPVYDPSVRVTEGFDIHRPSIEDLVKYKGKPGDQSRSAAVPRAGAQSSATGGNPDPDWEPEDDKFDPQKEEVKDYKKSDFQKGDNIGLHRFTQKVNSRTWKDPKSGQYIEKDRALNTGARPHGPSRWKLYDRFERLLGTITKDGSFYKGPPK